MKRFLKNHQVLDFMSYLKSWKIFGHTAHSNMIPGAYGSVYIIFIILYLFNFLASMGKVFKFNAIEVYVDICYIIGIC